MKPPRLLIQVYGCLAISIGLAAPAFAQGIPVIDSTSIVQLVNQLNEAKQQYSELVSQYQELKSTYQAVSQDVNPNQWAQQLEQPLMQNSTPNTSLIPGMLDGLSPPSQLGGNLGSLAQQFYNQNKVYIPAGNSFGAAQTQQGANETANFEAVATQNLQSLEAREAALPQIQNQLNSATTIQQVDSINARLSAEQNYVQAQQAQAQNLQLLAYEQTQSQEGAVAEQNEQGTDQTLSTLCSDAASLGGAPSSCP
jgi:hypothetical protein